MAYYASSQVKIVNGAVKHVGVVERWSCSTLERIDVFEREHDTPEAAELDAQLLVDDLNSE